MQPKQYDDLNRRQLPPPPKGVPPRLHGFFSDVAKAAAIYERPEDRFTAVVEALRWAAGPEMSQRIRSEESLLFTRWVTFYSSFYQATLEGPNVALPCGSLVEAIEMCLAIICFRPKSQPLPEALFFLSPDQT